MKTIIYGNGAMAKVLYSYASSVMDIVGFTVDSVCIHPDEKLFCGLPLKPFDQVEESFPPENFNMIIAVGFLDMNNLRERKYLEAIDKGYTFTSYIHNSVIRHFDVEIGAACIILDHVSIHPGTKIGRNTFISSNVNIGHDCVIGPNNWINAGVSLAGGVKLDAGCFLGVNSSIGQNIKVGKENFIAANTFIARDTGPEEVYLSEPGQKMERMKSRTFLKFSQMST